MEGEDIIELELSIVELVDAILGTDTAQGFDLIVDLHSVDVDVVVPPTLKLSNAKCRASLLSSFLLENSSYCGVNDITSFQKLVCNLDKTTFANLDRQHQKSLDSYFKSS